MRTLADVLAPRVCAGCAEEGSWLCARCASAVARDANVTCIGCRALARCGETCERCRATVRLRAVVAATRYDDPVVARLVRTVKYAPAGDVASAFRVLIEGFVGSPVGTELREAVRGSAVIVPVPLSARHMRMRGFNQSAIIARELARAGFGAVQDVLTRRGTLPWRARAQARLARNERIANVTGVFSLRTDVGVDLRAARVLLVDDVVTTGATLTACAHALHPAHPRAVYAFTLAREV